ncbi:hypothetical protein Mapa_001713 [Marchantia paleacea]|nr:hypothetical protein Mapa_001713 [Marchantia paleacea]
MARGRSRFKLCDLPIFPTLGLVVGSLFIVALLLSVFKSHLLEVQRFYEVWDHPVPVSEQKNVTPKPVPVLKQPWEPTSVEDVPKGGDSRLREVWNSSTSEYYNECSDPSTKYVAATSTTGQNGYMLTDANGDLYLQRAGIADFVTIARILDVTMVVPSLAHGPNEHDTSNFSEVFDTDHFISTLSSDVRIIKQLPDDVKMDDPSVFVPPRKSTAIWYEVKLLQELQTKKVVRFSQTDYRLQDNLGPDHQKLRCRAMYKALRFAPPIRELGQSLAQRLRDRNKHGRYIAVHIRFDEELLSSSGCYFGGGDKERRDLRNYRQRWKPTFHNKDPHKERREGRCPLTPMELGLLLRAMGFGEMNVLYIVMGEVYGGEESLAPLKKLFPYHYTRNTLAGEQELAPFQAYPSKLAALDYTICEQSDAFAANDNGDMARVIAGHRRFDGHRRTIRPNFQKLALLYVARHSLGWYQFASKLRIFHEGMIGDPKEKSKEFYEVPSVCICAQGQFEFIKSAHEGRELIKRIRKSKRNGTAGVMDPELEMAVEEEMQKQTGETIAEEMLNTGINESLVVDEDEDAETPEDWPWLMN